MMAMIGSFFFFSSRRRHTRCSRDWSSDVCSSDLSRAALGLLPDETITLAFADRQGISRVALGLTARQAASLALADSDGVTRAGMGVAADGKSTVTTLNGPGGSTTVVPQ